MLKWSGLLVRLGGGRQPHFSEDFFSRLDHEILVVDDIGYTGIDFRHDPDLVLPEGEDWDAALGMLRSLLFMFLMYFLIFLLLFFFFFYCLTQYFFLHRSRAIATGRDVSVGTELCCTGRC